MIFNDTQKALHFVDHCAKHNDRFINVLGRVFSFILIVYYTT